MNKMMIIEKLHRENRIKIEEQLQAAHSVSSINELSSSKILKSDYLFPIFRIPHITLLRN